MAAGVALGGIPVTGQLLTGAAIGVGVNYAAQTQLSTDGDIKLSEVLMGGITGGLTMGRGVLPTILINTGGAMITSAWLNDNIGASMTGAAVGSTLGWGTGNLVEGLGKTVARRLTGDVFWQTSKGFSSDLIEMPLGISAPVVREGPWPVIGGTTIGGGVQEVSGDTIKNLIKGTQP